MAWICTKWVVLGDAAAMWFPDSLAPLSFTFTCFKDPGFECFTGGMVCVRVRKREPELLHFAVAPCYEPHCHLDCS